MLARWRRWSGVVAATLGAALLAHVSWMRLEHSVYLLFLPLLLLAARGRVDHAIIMFGYCGYNSVELAPILLHFFDGRHAWLAYSAPLALAVLLSLPFTLIDAGSRPILRFWQAFAAFSLTVLPPIGFVGWLSPVFVAGALYPGWGVAGVLLALLALAFLAVCRGQTSRALKIAGWSAVMVLPVVANAIYAGPKQGGASVMPITTWFGKPAVGVEYRSGVWSEMADTVGRHVGRGWPDLVVFPESVIHGYSDVDRVGLAPLRFAKGRPEVWFGATIERSDGRIENVILNLEGDVVSRTRLPVPIGNWRPFMRGGVPARPFDSDLVSVKGGRVAVSICYEDVVIWPHFGLLTFRADALVSVANLWALSDTRTALAQSVAAHLLARMAGVPLYRSVNRREWVAAR